MSTPPRLLILSKYFSYGYGGTPEAVLLVARSLDQSGVAVDVYAHDRFVPNAGKLGDLPAQDAPPGDRNTPNMADYSGLIIAGAWILNSLPLALAARRADIPILYQTKGQLCRVEFTRLRDLRRIAYLLLIEFWVALLATNIQFTSRLEQTASLLPGWLKRKKGIVLPEPLDGERLGHVERKPHLPDAPLRLGFIAQISPRKGLREFIEGLLAWSEAHPGKRIDFTIAGTAVGASEAYLDDIKSMVATHPCDTRIDFIGQISGADRTRFYAETDIIVVPSHFESFCLAVPEALWYGCAVLASPKLGVLEFLNDQPAIQIMSDLSPPSIAAALNGLEHLASRPLRPETSRADLSEKLSGRRIAETILEQILERRGKVEENRRRDME